MENKGTYLNEVPQSGEVTFLAVVIEKELRPKRNGASFLALRFADRGGELDGKVWDSPEAVAKLFECNDVAKVRGIIEHYNEKPQLIVSRIRRCEPHEYDPIDFYPASERDLEEMFGCTGEPDRENGDRLEARGAGDGPGFPRPDPPGYRRSSEPWDGGPVLRHRQRLVCRPALVGLWSIIEEARSMMEWTRRQDAPSP